MIQSVPIIFELFVVVFLDVNYFSDTDKQQALPALIKIKVIHLHWYTFEEYSLWYSSMVSFFEIFIFNYSRGV